MRISQIAAAMILVLIAGCSPKPQPPPPSIQPEVRPELVVGTSEQITSTDPAGPTSRGNDLVYLDVFQRLMVVHSDGSLRPDAAQDCAFRAIAVYECVLKKNLRFHNGHDLTSSDVKFSIERALKLRAPGTSNLSALREIETHGPQVVRFQLAWPDAEFGMFLAMPSASIVDEQIYEPTKHRSLAGLPVGSGPFTVVSQNPYQIHFERFADYLGAVPAKHDQISIRHLADSPAGEKALAEGQVDVLWRTLTPAAVKRSQQLLSGDRDGYTYTPIAGAQVFRVRWNANSPLFEREEIRLVLAKAWQRDRTLDSLLPVGTKGRVSAFEMGGEPKMSSISQIIKLEIPRDSPGVDEIGWSLAGAAEKYAGLSVQLADENADLVLVDSEPPIDTAFGWLRYFINRAEPRAQDLERSARTTLDQGEREAAIQTLQKMAATKLIELPVSQYDIPLYLKNGVSNESYAFGPGKQFVLWGLRK